MSNTTGTNQANRQQAAGNYYDDHQGAQYPVLAATAVVAGTAAVVGAATAPVYAPAPTYAPAPAAAPAPMTAVNALPCAAEPVVAGSAAYYNCGGVWYMPAYVGGNVAYVVTGPPPG